ncbi:MAG: hypothetical protein ABL951_00190 [Alphaproteobacteria bacterium]
MTKRQIDWEAVSRDYHAGAMPVPEIARKHGLAPVSIYAKANRCCWARPGTSDTVKPGKPARRPSIKNRRLKFAMAGGDVNAARALARMMNIVNRLADELELHLDHPNEGVMSATEKKGAADILTSLARALEKLIVLEREAGAHPGSVIEADAIMAENNLGALDGWDEVQRRLARLAAATPEG